MYNHQLDTFISVADLGSFGKAGEKLYISPTAVSQQINLLENACGFRLFERTNRGVRLTPAGKSLYNDALAMIRFSENALQKAKLLAESSETTVRIATGVLFKCRLLPQICASVGEINPGLKFEIPPTGRGFFTEGGEFRFGPTHDVLEGIFCSTLWKDKHDFLELLKTPMCCAVSTNHRFASRKKLTLKDLDTETLLMPMRGASYELDALRDEILEKCPDTEILDSPGYGLDTFTMCEMLGYVLLTQPVYSDVHTNLVTIPLETDCSLPYGLIYSKSPTPAMKKFISIVRDMKEHDKIDLSSVTHLR